MRHWVPLLRASGAHIGDVRSTFKMRSKQTRRVDMSAKKIMGTAIAIPAVMALSISTPIAANASDKKPPCTYKAIDKALTKSSNGAEIDVDSKKCKKKDGMWWAAGEATFGGEDDGVYLLYGKQKKNGKWKWKDDGRDTCESDIKSIPKKLRYVCKVS